MQCSQAKNDSANSVLLPIVATNVASILLGFGLPYSISAIWRSYEGSSPLLIGQYETGHIALAIASLFVVSSIAYLILGFRRWVEGGELGGHKSLRIGSAILMILMWAASVSLNATNSQKEWRTFEPSYLDDGISATQLQAVGMIKAQHAFGSTSKVCRARIEFTCNPGLASPFRRYRIQVRDRNGQFQSVQTNCQQYNRQVMCDVPMSILTQAPFNLMDGDIIMVRASALLRTGWSAYSKVNSGEPKVIGPPSAVTNLRQEGAASHKEVNLVWDAGVQAPGTTYDIMQSAGPGSPFTRISFSREASYSVKNLQPGLTYIFRVRTKNQCNFADSEPLRVTTDFQSVTDPQAVRVTSNRCNVRLNWKSPQPGAGQRFYYQISLQDKQSNTVSFPACGRTFQTSCLFHMQALGNAPTSLTPGDAIIAYVKTCDVYTGRCSEYSPMSNKDVLMSQNPPSKMEMPNHSNKDRKQDRFIELTWQHVVQTSDPNAKPYVIEMCEGPLETCRTVGAKFRGIGKSKDPSWKQDLTPGQYDYAFRVKACTSCGCSLACDPLPVRVEKLCTMPLVRASTQPCGVQFNWGKPTGCGQVEGYKLEVRGADGKYQEWNGCAQDSNSCTIPYDTLATVPFELKTGGQITAKVSALNVVGWSDASISNPVYMADLVCSEPSLTRIGDSHTEITVTWTRPSRAQKLNLLWDQGVVGGEFVIIPISQAATRYTVKIPPHNGSVDFTFRLDVSCSCNREVSKELKIKLPEKPQAPDLSCSVRKCQAVDFAWNEPDDGRAPIQRYSLSIRGVNDQWHSVRKCGNNNNSLKCSLSMQELMSSPYNLKVADKIDAKIFASNKVGDGHENQSTPCTGDVTEVWVLPCKPKKPVLVLDEDKTTKKMTVKWDGCPDSTELTYKLYWDAGIQNPNQDTFTLLTETQQKNEFTVDTMDIDSRFFNYFVEAINPCGSQRSEVYQRERKTTPPADHKVLTEGTCNVTISVSPPKDDGGFPITSGRWEIKNAQQDWEEYTPCATGATKSGNLFKCRFPMRNLARAPFNLLAGDNVQVRVCLASKQLGCGEFKEAENSPLSMYQIAASLEKPQILELPDQLSIEMNWIGCTEPGCKNEVEFGEQGKRKRAIRLNSNTQTTHVQSNLTPGVIYDFCVRSTHSCEKTEWACSSGKILVVSKSPTCVPSSGKCEARLSWRPPTETGGTPITHYLVSIQTRDGDRMGNYLENSNCGKTGDEIRCSITMKDLALAPFGLLPGDQIRYKLRAVNAVGESAESAVCNCVKMKDTNPPHVAAPTISNKNDAGFDVRFNSVIGNEELYCDNGDGVTYSKMITSPGMNYYRMAITPGVKEYRCFVQAQTECGGLGKSNILTIDVTKPPGCPILRIKGQCTDQQLIWTPPANDGGKPVEGYKFEIETHRKFANGQRMWKEYMHCGDASPCKIDMEMLNQPPFSILNGESVAVRASARNSNGYGPTCGCSQKILMAKSPPRIWLTASKENNQIKVCWNSPFRAASVLGHKFTLNWGTKERAQGSVDPIDGMDQSVETTQTCHTVTIAPGSALYRFVVRASNICGPGSYSPEVRVEVAICKGETCHHGGPPLPHHEEKQELRPTPVVLEPSTPAAPVANLNGGGWVGPTGLPANTVPVQPVTTPYYPAQPYNPAPAQQPYVPVQQPVYPAVNLPSQNGWQCPAPVVPPQPQIIHQQNVMRTSWCPVGLNGQPLLAAEPDTTYELYYASGKSDSFEPLAEGPTCEYSMNIVQGQNMKFKVRAKRSCGAVSEWSDVTYDQGLVPQYQDNSNGYSETSWQTVNEPVSHTTPHQSNAWTNTPEHTSEPVVTPPAVTPSTATPQAPNNAWTSSQPVAPASDSFGFEGHEHDHGHGQLDPNAWQTVPPTPTQPAPTPIVAPPSGSSWQMNPSAIGTGGSVSENGPQWAVPPTPVHPEPAMPVIQETVVPTNSWVHNTSVPIDGAQWNTAATANPTEPTWQQPSLPTSQGWQSTTPLPTPTHIVSPAPVSPIEPEQPVAVRPEHQASGKQVRTSPAYGTCGAIMIEWDRISDAGSPIYQQKVEVKGADGSFYSANLGCGTRTSMNLCVVSSSTLMKAPYSLQAGDLVVARVSVAFSQWTVSISENTSGAHLTSAKVPDAMQAPIVRKNPDNSFSISWHANSAIPQEYELVWDAGKSWLPVDQLVTKTSASNFNTQAVVPRNAYRFAVRASNQCGTGPYSTPVSIFVP